MKIPLENVPSNPVFLGGRSRPGSATSVALLSNNLLACAHFNACKLYLFGFDLDKGQYQLLDTIDTTFQGKLCETDLMTYNQQDTLVTTNFFKQSCTMYKVDGNSLRHDQDILYHAGGPLHGVKYFNPHTLAVTSRRASAGIHFIDVAKAQLLSVIRTPGKSVQDVCFLGDHRLVMISTTDSPKMQADKMWDSVIDIIDFDLANNQAELIVSQTFVNCHFDSIVSHANSLYVTDQYNDQVVRFHRQTLQIEDTLNGYSFPHGIDINHGLLAVTNYGLNTVEIRPLQ